MVLKALYNKGQLYTQPCPHTCSSRLNKQQRSMARAKANTPIR